MGVTRGRKKTDVGLIPTDWNVVPLGEIATVSSGGTPSRRVDEFWGGGIYWVTTAEIDFNEVNETTESITALGMKHSAAKLLQPGTLLMALYGQGKTRGKVAILGVAATTNQACASIWVSGGVSRKFVFHYLASQYVAIRGLSNSGSQENLSGQIVRSLKIPLAPSKEEQEAIADALSDADSLIESLEQLLAKKRQIKQGAMQELLTGEKRLPGFSGRWRASRLGDFGVTYGGLTGKSKSDFGHGTARYITFMNVMSNVVIDCTSFDSVDVRSKESQNSAAAGDLFFNGSSETPEEVGMCAYLDTEVQGVYLNSFCFGFRARADAPIDRLYLAYYFRSSQGRELLESLAQGATRYNLSKTALLRVEFPLPKVEEQVAIATILSDMDAELAALERKLIKARRIKQGMMQELLTGRIRLI